MQYKVSGSKRFIAGAVCPKCKAMDKTVTFPVKRVIKSGEQGHVEVEDEIMACVSCLFEQSKLDLSEPSQKSPLRQADVAPLRILDATKK